MVSKRLVVVAASVALLLAGVGLEPFFAQAPASVSVALTGARLIDGTGRPPIDEATLVVRNGRVEAVGPIASTPIPAEAVRIDLTGKTIIPGLVSAHAHVNAVEDSPLSVRDQLLTQLRTYAQYGVTTAYSLGSNAIDEAEGVRIRDEQAQGRFDGARLYTSGVVVDAKTAEEARKSVDRLADLKVDIVKIRVDGPDGTPGKMTPEVYGAVIDQAHKRGLRVAAHLFYLSDAKKLLDAGLDVVAHSVRDRTVDESVIADLKRLNVGYIPTLTRELSVFVYESTPAFFSDPFFLRGTSVYGKQVEMLSDPARQAKTRANKDAQSIKQALDQATRNLKRLSDAGVTIAMGTDTGANLIGRWQGYFEHLEIEMMVKAGLTPMQAIVASTGNAAKVMKVDKQVGTLEAGKTADCVVLAANPLADIRNLQKIEAVWIAGRRRPAP
jgi:imidazolonepropionase-like amidohydrolase